MSNSTQRITYDLLPDDLLRTTLRPKEAWLIDWVRRAGKLYASHLRKVASHADTDQHSLDIQESAFHTQALADLVDQLEIQGYDSTDHDPAPGYLDELRGRATD